MIPFSNFAFLAFLDLLPLIYSTSLELCENALSTIGSILGWLGVLNRFVQVFVFPWSRKRVGHRNFYLAGVVELDIGLGMFPILNWLARMGE